MTREELSLKTRKELAQMARGYRVPGWHDMRKDALIESIVECESRPRAAYRNDDPNGHDRHHNGNGSRSQRDFATKNGADVRQRSTEHRRPLIPRGKDLSSPQPAEDQNGVSGEQIRVQVVDPYFLLVAWNLPSESIQRARSALRFDWNTAVPILRLFESPDDDQSSAVWSFTDIQIHGRVCHWFVPVGNPGRQYRVAIGYRSKSGQFVCLVRSDGIDVPSPGSACAAEIGSRWPFLPDSALNYRADGATGARRDAWLDARSGEANGDSSSETASSYPFQVEAELLIHGTTDAEARLLFDEEEVSLAPDGSFSVRCRLEDGRQILPFTSIHPHGFEQHRIVLSVDLNKKRLEREILDIDDYGYLP